MNEELKQKLEEMKEVDIRTVDINTLIDINEITIDPNLPIEDRLLKFIEQIKNPYCYRCGDMIVKISYADTDVTFEERMESYLKNLES